MQFLTGQTEKCFLHDLQFKTLNVQNIKKVYNGFF